MPKERRYTRYKQADVWNTLINLESALKVQVIRRSVHGSSVSLMRLDKQPNERYRAVILARSSDWYSYRLNCTSQWEHGITAVICGTHDSCLKIPVLALDAMKWYDPLKMRMLFGPLQPTFDADDHLIPDQFDHARKSHYGHNMLIGALMCGREDALARLNAMRPSTRYRIEAELLRLHTRRQGRPLEVASDPESRKTKA
jgi:hypothetical protein